MPSRKEAIATNGVDSTAKVVLRLFGGLGNQLFIYAAGRRLSLANGAELVLDHVSGFRRDFKYQRRFMLDRFNIAARLAAPRERLEPLQRVRQYLKRSIALRQPFERRRYLRQEGIDFDPRLLNYEPCGTVHIEGYWQSEGYFVDVADIIRGDLMISPPADPRNRDLAAEMRESESVALHVRFFDDPDDRGRNDAPEAYYRRALQWMDEAAPDAHYFVFSDKPAEALSRLPLEGRTARVVDHNKSDDSAHLDLWLMSQCRHMIMANSTFSWWGAWLGEKPGGCVIAPGFKMREGRMSWGFEGLLPARWIKI